MPRYNVNHAENIAKIDNQLTDGLTGVGNSLAYRTNEIENHLHSFERWLEVAAVPNAEIHVADSIGVGNGIFQLDAGDDDWGAWVQILGSSDTPVISGSIKFDLHRFLIEDTERNEVYFVQIALGSSGAVALAAGNYTETVIQPLSNQVGSTPTVIQNHRQDAGTKVWARCKCPGQNTATLNLYFGIHEYEG